MVSRGSILLAALLCSLFLLSVPAWSAAPADGPTTPAGKAALALPTGVFGLGELVPGMTFGVSSAELSGVGLAGATAASTAGDGPNMYIVDDNRADCPNAAFTSIQAAVAAAGPRDQIKVCPGTYNEQVRIGPGKDGLTLFSQVPLQAVIKAPPVMTRPRSIVFVDGATDVTIRQFAISGPFTFPACAEALDRNTGVRVGNGSATLYGNHITQIRNLEPTLYGCQDGIAVQIGRRLEAQAGVATLRNNLVDLYQKGGVLVDGEGSYADVTQNEVRGDSLLSGTTAQNGVQISRNASADVDHNLVYGNFFFRDGLDDSAAGILLFDTTAAVTVGHNDVYANGVGIDIDQDVAGQTIDHNTVHDNRNYGIGVFTGSSGNTISYNKAYANTPLDCHDETVGPGTAGTANFWLHDQGDTEDRAGICKRTG
jgi:parallel beta-helix repeat protein